MKAQREGWLRKSQMSAIGTRKASGSPFFLDDRAVQYQGLGSLRKIELDTKEKSPVECVVQWLGHNIGNLISRTDVLDIEVLEIHHVLSDGQCGRVDVLCCCMM